MILPPYSPDPRAEEYLDAASPFADVRIPASFGTFGDPRHPAPVGETERGPCNVPGTARGRHLFDAIEVDEGDQWTEDDDPAPTRFRLTLTCVECGLVVRFGGTLDPEERGYRTQRIDPTPLRAGRLLAQQITPGDGWSRATDTWTVYLDRGRDAEPRRVGVVGWARGPRGRAYYVGRIGPKTQWEGTHADRAPRVEAPSPISALRKLARYVDVAEAYVAEQDADVAAWRAGILERMGRPT